MVRLFRECFCRAAAAGLTIAVFDFLGFEVKVGRHIDWLWKSAGSRDRGTGINTRFNCILVAGGEDGAGCCGFTNSLSWLAKTSSIAVRSPPDLALSTTRRIPWRSASPVTAELYMVNITIGVLGRRFLMAAAALSPSICGMAKSRTTRSGFAVCSSGDGLAARHGVTANFPIGMGFEHAADAAQHGLVIVGNEDAFQRPRTCFQTIRADCRAPYRIMPRGGLAHFGAIYSPRSG